MQSKIHLIWTKNSLQMCLFLVMPQTTMVRQCIITCSGNTIKVRACLVAKSIGLLQDQVSPFFLQIPVNFTSLFLVTYLAKMLWWPA